MIPMGKEKAWLFKVTVQGTEQLISVPNQIREPELHL